MVQLQGADYLRGQAYTYSEEIEKEQRKLGTKTKISLKNTVEGIY
jgi:hypothetical protein